MRRTPSAQRRCCDHLAAALCVSAGLVGCAAEQQPPAIAAANDAVVATAGDATIEVIWPCRNSPIFGTGRGGSRWAIMINEKQSGTLTACSHARLRVAAGSYPIRIADPSLDLRGLFGNTGPKIEVKSGATLHFVVRQETETSFRLVAIDDSRAQAEVKAIEDTP